MLCSVTKFIAQPLTLWVAFAAFVLLVIGFQVSRPLVGGVLLDELHGGATVVNALTAMSTDQLWQHLAVTMGLDFLFPVVYGVLFGGIIIRSFREYSPALLLPVVILLIADVLENLSHIAMLIMVLVPVDINQLSFLAWCKSIVTQSKFSMLYLTVAIVLLALLRLSIRGLLALRKHSAADDPRN